MMRDADAWLDAAWEPVASWLRTAPRFSAARGPGWWHAGISDATIDENWLVVTGGVEALAVGFEQLGRLGGPATLCLGVRAAATLADPVSVLPVTVAGALPHYRLELDRMIRARRPSIATIERVVDADGFRSAMGVLSAAFDDPYHHPDGNWRVALLDDPRLTFRIARVDGIAASTLVTWRDGEIGYVVIMGTAPDFQGRGFGRRLLDEAMREERAAGVRWTHLVASDAGARLYRRAGFELIANHPLFTYQGQ